MLSRREPCHVLHQPEDGHVYLLVAVHVDAFAGVGQRYLLGRADNDGPGDGNGLDERKVNVGSAGRRVEDEIVQVAPVGISYELLQGVACHASAPHDALLGADEEADAEHLDAILLHRHDEVAPVHVFAVGAGIFQLEHLGCRGAEDVAVEQADAHAHAGHGNGQVDGHGALAHTAFSAGDGDDVPDAGQQVGQVGAGCLQGACLDFHLGILRGVGVDGGFGCFHHAAHEGVGGLVEDEREGHAESGDAQVVVHHLHFHDVLARAGVAYRGQGIEYKFGVKFHCKRSYKSYGSYRSYRSYGSYRPSLCQGTTCPSLRERGTSTSRWLLLPRKSRSSSRRSCTKRPSTRTSTCFSSCWAAVLCSSSS